MIGRLIVSLLRLGRILPRNYIPSVLFPVGLVFLIMGPDSVFKDTI